MKDFIEKDTRNEKIAKNLLDSVSRNDLQATAAILQEAKAILASDGHLSYHYNLEDALETCREEDSSEELHLQYLSINLDAHPAEFFAIKNWALESIYTSIHNIFQKNAEGRVPLDLDIFYMLMAFPGVENAFLGGIELLRTAAKHSQENDWAFGKLQRILRIPEFVDHLIEADRRNLSPYEHFPPIIALANKSSQTTAVYCAYPQIAAYILSFQVREGHPLLSNLVNPKADQPDLTVCMLSSDTFPESIVEEVCRETLLSRITSHTIWTYFDQAFFRKAPLSFDYVKDMVFSHPNWVECREKARTLFLCIRRVFEVKPDDRLLPPELNPGIYRAILAQELPKTSTLPQDLLSFKPSVRDKKVYEALTGRSKD